MRVISDVKRQKKKILLKCNEYKREALLQIADKCLSAIKERIAG
jgi:hypothetical protein